MPYDGVFLLVMMLWTCDFVSIVGLFLLIIIWSNEIVTLDIDWEKNHII